MIRIKELALLCHCQEPWCSDAFAVSVMYQYQNEKWMLVQIISTRN
jgi:hypothetical protein